MNNYVVLIGRIVNELTIDSDTKNCEITIAISRSFKNEDGIYETDFIPVRLYNDIAKNVVEYCKKGDLVGIKGRVQTKQEENKNTIEIIAERVSFLTSKSNKEEE